MPEFQRVRGHNFRNQGTKFQAKMFDWLATTKGQWKRKSSGYHFWSLTGVSATLRSHAHSRLLCAEFVFAASAAQETEVIKLSELLGRDWIGKWRTICNSKAGFSLRGVLAHGVIDVNCFFCALGGHIPVSSLKGRKWSSQTPWFSDAKRIVRLVFVGVAFVPRGSVDLGVEWSANIFRVSSMLANRRAIGPFPVYGQCWSARTHERTSNRKSLVGTVPQNHQIHLHIGWCSAAAPEYFTSWLCTDPGQCLCCGNLGDYLAPCNPAMTKFSRKSSTRCNSEPRFVYASP